MREVEEGARGIFTKKLISKRQFLGMTLEQMSCQKKRRKNTLPIFLYGRRRKGRTHQVSSITNTTPVGEVDITSSGLAEGGKKYLRPTGRKGNKDLPNCERSRSRGNIERPRSQRGQAREKEAVISLQVKAGRKS